MNINIIEERALEIETFVATNDLKRAVMRLLDFISDFCNNKQELLNDAMVINDELHFYLKNNSSGTSPYAETIDRRNNLIIKILTFKDSILTRELS